MRKPHALAVTSMIGAAAIAGVLALTQTVSLGQASRQTPDAVIEDRQAALARAEEQIASLDASRPPALPDRATSARSTTPQVVYVTAPRVEQVASRGEHDDEDGDEDGRESEHEGREADWDD